MDWIAEQTAYIAVIGGVMLAGLCYWALNAGAERKWVMTAAATVALVTALLIGLGMTHETEKQRVGKTLQELADYVQDNDVESVLRYIDDSVPNVLARARNEMPQYRFQSVDIKERTLEVEIDESASPPTATATFNITVVVSDRGGMVSNQNVPRFIELKLVKRGDNWKITDYDHSDFMESMRR